jgi:hypothetical protein
MKNGKMNINDKMSFKLSRDELNELIEMLKTNNWEMINNRYTKVMVVQLCQKLYYRLLPRLSKAPYGKPLSVTINAAEAAALHFAFDCISIELPNTYRYALKIKLTGIITQKFA